MKTWVFNGEVIGDKQRRAAVLPKPRQEEDRGRRRRRPQARRRPSGDRPVQVDVDAALVTAISEVKRVNT